MTALVAGLLAVLLLPALAAAADPIAALTEIHGRRGQVQIKAASGGEWSAPKPLQSLRPGDQIRATGEGRAVLVFTGGRGTAVVTEANSPFAVAVPIAEGLSDRARAVIGGVTNFLLRQQRERTYQALTTRSVRVSRAPILLGPRTSRVLPHDVMLEWSGPQRAHATVRVVGSQGVVWEQETVDVTSVAYPASAPALASGAYVWEMEMKGHGLQAAQFEVASAHDAATVRESLAVLTPAVAPGYPPPTLALLRASVLFQERFYAGARRELLAAIAASPDEPTLHLLLGHVYDRIGLRDLAGQSFTQAEALATR